MAGFALLTLAACQAGSSVSRSSELDMNWTRDGLFEVDAELFGEGPLRLIVDTGSERSAIDPQIMRRLDLPVRDGAFHAYGLFSVEMVDGSQGARVRAGDFESSDTLMVMPMHGSGAGLPADGILGMDALFSQRATHRYVVLDFATSKLSAKRDLDARMRRGISNWTDLETPNPDHPGFLIFDVSIGGIDGKAVLDSGLAFSVMNRQFAEALALRGRASFANLTDVHGEVVAPMAMPSRPMRTLGLNWDRIQLMVYNAEAFGPLGLDNEPAILLGADLIASTVIVVDTRLGKITALPESPDDTAPLYDLNLWSTRLN